MSCPIALNTCVCCRAATKSSKEIRPIAMVSRASAMLRNSFTNYRYQLEHWPDIPDTNKSNDSTRHASTLPTFFSIRTGNLYKMMYSG